MPVKVRLVLAIAVSLAACADMEARPKQTGGVLLGGAAGGLAGSQIGHGSGQLAATAAGTLLGALVGGEVGRSLDQADRLYAAQTTQRALEASPSGQARNWRNPDSGHSGTIMPLRTYQTAQGENCREFQQTVTVGGRVEEAYGTACRQPDGNWRIVQ